jgi:hypothetical protein
MDKKYCEIHHLYYSSGICPFCQSEKYERMSRNYNHKPKKEKKDDSTKPVEITEDVLEKLKKHFAK